MCTGPTKYSPSMNPVPKIVFPVFLTTFSFLASISSDVATWPIRPHLFLQPFTLTFLIYRLLLLLSPYSFPFSSYFLGFPSISSETQKYTQADYSSSCSSGQTKASQELRKSSFISSESCASTSLWTNITFAFKTTFTYIASVKI